VKLGLSLQVLLLFGDDAARQEAAIQQLGKWLPVLIQGLQ
jgi:hypothetical protein